MVIKEFTLEDGFILSEILDKMDYNLDLNALADASKKGKDAQAYLGGQMMLELVKKLYKAKPEVMKFIAHMTGQKVEEVRNFTIAETKEFFAELFKQEGLTDFFS